MENASKALIIAGAILISIILISIGIMVIQSGNQLVDEAGAQMDAQTLQAYNTRFTNNLGKQRGSTVSSLIQSVQSNNATREDLPITVTFNGQDYTGNDVTKVISQVRNSTTYEIDVDYSDAGRVNKIIITGGASGSGGASN